MINFVATSRYTCAGVAELADAQDLKFSVIFSPFTREHYGVGAHPHTPN